MEGKLLHAWAAVSSKAGAADAHDALPASRTGPLMLLMRAWGSGTQPADGNLWKGSGLSHFTQKENLENRSPAVVLRTRRLGQQHTLKPSKKAKQVGWEQAGAGE